MLYWKIIRLTGTTSLRFHGAMFRYSGEIFKKAYGYGKAVNIYNEDISIEGTFINDQIHGICNYSLYLMDKFRYCYKKRDFNQVWRILWGSHAREEHRIWLSVSRFDNPKSDLETVLWKTTCTKRWNKLSVLTSLKIKILPIINLVELNVH